MQESRNYHSNRFEASQRLSTPLPDSLEQKRFLLDQAVALAPDLPQVNNAMADFLITDMNDYNAAEPFYRKSSMIPSSPNYYGAVINLGHIAALKTLHEKADFWQKAADFYREAIAWNPFLSRAYLSMAHYHSVRKEWSLAEQVLKEGLRFIPDSPEILEMLQEIREKSGKK
jgi:tetratricopeptide (TPR) repeat protein